jgi:curved DNA-binding protein CbpA
MNQAMNLYDVLGVKQDASPDAIRRAYRTLAKRFHPDAHPNDKEAGERFREVAQAYEILSDPRRRRQYDLTQPEKETEGSNVELASFRRNRGRGFIDALRRGTSWAAVISILALALLSACNPALVSWNERLTGFLLTTFIFGTLRVLYTYRRRSSSSNDRGGTAEPGSSDGDSGPIRWIRAAGRATGTWYKGARTFSTAIRRNTTWKTLLCALGLAVVGCLAGHSQRERLAMSSALFLLTWVLHLGAIFVRWFDSKENGGR